MGSYGSTRAKFRLRPIAATSIASTGSNAFPLRRIDLGCCPLASVGSGRSQSPEKKNTMAHLWDRGVLDASSWHGLEELGTFSSAADMIAHGERTGAWPVAVQLK